MLLAGTSMYFRVRDKDIFGKTHSKAEDAKMKADLENVVRTERGAQIWKGCACAPLAWQRVKAVL